MNIFAPNIINTRCDFINAEKDSWLDKKSLRTQTRSQCQDAKWVKCRVVKRESTVPNSECPFSVLHRNVLFRMFKKFKIALDKMCTQTGCCSFICLFSFVRNVLMLKGSAVDHALAK